MRVVSVERLVPLMTEKMQARFGTLPFVPKSAIVRAFPIFTGAGEGNIAMFARVRDYHAVVYGYMQKYERELSEQYPDMTFLALKNGGPLPIVAAANMCGVGFTGRHGMQIVEPYGSYVSLSAVACDAELPETPPLNETCLGCGECEKACPTKAMYFDGQKRVLDRSRCIAHVTQNREADAELLRLSTYVWGCDICQSVCPHNQNAALTDIPEFTEGIISVIVNDSFSGNLSDRHYAKRLDVLKRNLEFVK